MLRKWYGLADEALEDAIYDSLAMRDFVGTDLAIESVPDAITLLRFRHLLEKQALTQRIFEEVNANLAKQGLFMRKGSIVYATSIVAAAPSAKNYTKQCDPVMKLKSNGNQRYFGLKAHIGVDAVTGLTHRVAATMANVADVTMSGHLVRDEDEQGGVPQHVEPPVRREGRSGPRCCIEAKRGTRKNKPRKTLTGIREDQEQHPH